MKTQKPSMMKLPRASASGTTATPRKLDVKGVVPIASPLSSARPLPSAHAQLTLPRDFRCTVTCRTRPPLPSAPGRSNLRVCLLEADLRTAEFVAVDVETNGRAGEDCEITETGAVLVGGCELHDELESLVRVERPLSRGIERLTGITQAMVDSAPPAVAALGRLREMLDGRILVAHSA